MIRSATLTLLAIALLCGCAVNPATGKRHLALVGEQQEVALGREEAAKAADEFGVVDDAGLQAYVAGIGKALAAKSERPDLDWEFRVVDDTAVNAFALPGGFIFVTRGILAHFESEAELASVLGHEIGHVTARHGVNQMSKQQILGGGAGLLSILAGAYGGAAAAGAAQEFANLGLGLTMMKFSRDDERQADDLGRRYMLALGYDPQAAVDVFETLDRVSATAGGRVPNWASTHPAPENRVERANQAVGALSDTQRDGLLVRRDEYLARIDGIDYGVNPRHGYFRGQAFLHPDLGFRLQIPEGWDHRNYRAAVVGTSPEKDAVVQIELAKGTSARAALQEFLGAEAVEPGRPWSAPPGGLRSAGSEFRSTRQRTALAGVVSFVEHGGRVYRVLGYAAEPRWAQRREAIDEAVGSFRELTDPAILGVRPATLRVVTLDSAMTFGEAVSRFNRSDVPIEDLSIINGGLAAHTPLPVGRKIKIVEGDTSPE